MTIENIRPASIYSAPVEEERKAELPGKKKPHERKLKRKFKRKLKAAKANGKRAKRDAKRACRAQHNAERERDTVAAANALLQKRLESKDQDVTDALRDEDGFIRLKERNGKND
ncbi:hypothetical protein [Agathobaculum sp.]|uniref:hypothetical protein n=1 Tax=Agathobaculum TaxID=2048137 RepID=UPI003AB60299